MNGKGLTLNEYKDHIHLTENFRIYSEEKLKELSIDQVIDIILGYLEKEFDYSLPQFSQISYLTRQYSDKKRDLIHIYLTIRPPNHLPSEIITYINILLQKELKSRLLTDINNISSINDMISNGNDISNSIGLWQGDITTLKADCIVNAANNQFIGCFVPFHKCIDNVISDRAGPQVRLDCNTIRSLQGYLEPTGIAKITSAYNLPSQYIIHTVGPIWDNNANSVEKSKFEQQLSDCYKNILNLTNQLPDIKNLVFCSISTGIFGFPTNLAAKIAFHTVIEWIKESHLKNKDMKLNKIIFNVYSSRDYEIYRDIFQSYSDW